MVEIFICFKITLFILILLGYSYFFKDKFNIKLEFSFPLAIVVIIDAIYIFSLINLMMVGSIIIYILGIVLLIFYICKLKKEFFIKIFQFNILFPLLLLAFFSILIRNLHMLHFDNFSHWAVIVKQLISLNSLPNASNILTSYFEYPPGSAYFIYFLCFFTNNSESFQIIAQLILSIILSIPLLGILKKKNIINYIFWTCYVIFTLVIDISVADLLVDSLVGIVAVMCYCFFYQYKNNLRKCLWLFVPLNLFLLLVKNIAIFFYIINVICLFYLIFKNRKIFSKKDILINIGIVILPLLLFMFWKLRCKLVFGEMISCQSISLVNYKDNFSLKTIDDIKSIVIVFLKNLFSINNLATILVLLLLIVVTIFIIKSKKYKDIKLSLYILILFFSYNFFLLFSYIFSMTLDEALRLASYSRYIFTVVIFLVGIVIINGEYLLKKNAIYKIIILGILLIFVINSEKNLKNLFGYQEYSNSIRYELDGYFKDYQNVDFKNYNIIVISNEASKDMMISNLINYYLGYRGYLFIKDSSLLDEYNIKDYDYIITLDNNDDVSKFMKDCNCYDNKKGIYYNINRNNN